MSVPPATASAHPQFKNFLYVCIVGIIIFVSVILVNLSVAKRWPCHRHTLGTRTHHTWTGVTNGKFMCMLLAHCVCLSCTISFIVVENLFRLTNTKQKRASSESAFYLLQIECGILRFVLALHVHIQRAVVSNNLVANKSLLNMKSVVCMLSRRR